MQDRLAGKAVPSQYETVIRRKDGTKLPIEVSATRTTWQKGLCDLVFFRDISARKRMEEEILKISDWEQTRIGQDLHDILGQQLAGVAYLSQALERDLKRRRQTALAKAAEQIAAQARQAVEQVRQVARGLAPVPSGPGGLAEALRRMAGTAGQIYGVSCVFQGDDDPHVVERQVASHLYHIAQEAVTNAVRHGQARHITIRLTQTAGAGELVVEDDGTGFATPPKESGLGLRIMQYRADLIQGKLKVESSPGGGTRLWCRFPAAGAGPSPLRGGAQGNQGGRP
jgi:two-component system CheB/CheR fusion protein